MAAGASGAVRISQSQKQSYTGQPSSPEQRRTELHGKELYRCAPRWGPLCGEDARVIRQCDTTNRMVHPIKLAVVISISHPILSPATEHPRGHARHLIAALLGIPARGSMRTRSSSRCLHACVRPATRASSDAAARKPRLPMRGAWTTCLSRLGIQVMRSDSGRARWAAAEPIGHGRAQQATSLQSGFNPHLPSHPQRPSSSRAAHH